MATGHCSGTHGFSWLFFKESRCACRGWTDELAGLVRGGEMTMDAFREGLAEVEAGSRPAALLPTAAAAAVVDTTLGDQAAQSRPALARLVCPVLVLTRVAHTPPQAFQ